jgi:hypothetical protein
LPWRLPLHGIYSARHQRHGLGILARPDELVSRYEAEGRIAMTKTNIDWNDVEEAARQMAGNWRQFTAFVWSRGYRLPDADKWMIGYTNYRDAGLLARSNHIVITERLAPFSAGDYPDLVFERHFHFAFGYVDGLSIRVYRADGTITDAFREVCRIHKRLDECAILDEQDYSQREYEATLENYREAMGVLKDELPQGWEAKAYAWFCDHGQDRYIANPDDQGGHAPREAILEALRDLGLAPNVVVKKGPQENETVS